MNLEYTYLLDGSFPAESRVWIYQSNRLFTPGEALDLEDMIKEFTDSWKSHSIPVRGAGYLFFGQFLILIADESATGVSGCSTDSSVRFVKGIEQAFGVNMFDRTTLAFIVKDKIQLLPMGQLSYAFEQGFINADTLYFNNLVQTKDALEKEWIVAVGKSWLTRKIPALQA